MLLCDITPAVAFVCVIGSCFLLSLLSPSLPHVSPHLLVASKDLRNVSMDEVRILTVVGSQNNESRPLLLAKGCKNINTRLILLMEEILQYRVLYIPSG